MRPGSASYSPERCGSRTDGLHEFGRDGAGGTSDQEPNRSLIAGLNQDLQELVGGEIQLARAQIREGMARTLCRCMTYYRIQAAIKRAAKELA